MIGHGRGRNVERIPLMRQRVVLGRRHAGAYEVEEVDPGHQLHRIEPDPIFLDQLVKPHQVRMRQLGDVAELVLEPPEARRVEMEDRLKRNLLIALAVERS